MSNYEDDLDKAEALLYEYMNADQTEQYESRMNSGEWSWGAFASRVWAVGPEWYDAYVVDLGAGTVEC